MPTGHQARSRRRIRTFTRGIQSPVCCRYTTRDWLLSYDSNVDCAGPEPGGLPITPERKVQLCADAGEVVGDVAYDVEIGQHDDNVELREVLHVQAGRELEGASVEVE